MEDLIFQQSSHGHSTEPLVFTNLTEEQRQSILNNLDEHMRRAVLPVSILVAIGSVVGFFGNVMVISVYLFHYKPCNFRIFVLWLGFVDLLSTMIPMPGEVFTQMYWYTYPNVVVCKIKSFSNMFTVAAEAMLLFVITIDRYLKVCRPHGIQISINAAKFIVIGIFFFAVVISVPVPIFWGIHSENMTYENTEITVTICETDKMYIKRTDQVHYSYSVHGILGLVMCTLCLLIARTLIARSKPKAQNATPLQALDLRTIQASKKDKIDLDNEITKTTLDDIIAPNNDSQSDIRLELLKKTNAYKDIIPNSDNNSSKLEEATYRESQERQEKRPKKRSNMIKMNPKIKRMKKLRSKTVIMFVLTLTFIVTTVLYLTLLSYITKGILKTLTDGQKTAYFFFFRLYFINHIINPIIYGVLDHRFKDTVTACWRRKFGRFFQNSTSSN